MRNIRLYNRRLTDAEILLLPEYGVSPSVACGPTFKEKKMETTIKVTDKTITVTAKMEGGHKASFTRPISRENGYSLPRALRALAADIDSFASHR